ncbi:MAG TPA: pyridoxamine 5'-phosphate oxidase [Bacteroidales bacterium]|jgi:pyridoxamine 5'-phosphate oxidase|nr:pyridoxamine 5'-phosphate oxidase [Bacteroidales bacterium]
MEKKHDKIRNDYRQKPLTKKEVDPDPLKQFADWMDRAINSGIKEPTAMALSTVGKNLQPSTRMVLLKEIREGGFIFYTNYESRKGHQISENHYGSLLFFWPELERQIRIEGRIEKTSQEISEEYYLTRSAKRRIGAWASPQSQEIPDRKFLEDKQAEFELKFSGNPIQKPENWGGYLLIPYIIEFWQGRPNRLHDRIEYYMDDNDWKIRRLAP